MTGQLCRAFEGILSIIDSGKPFALQTWTLQAELSVEEPSTAVECLIALQAFDMDAHGNFIPEPLLSPTAGHIEPDRSGTPRSADGVVTWAEARVQARGAEASLTADNGSATELPD